MRLQRALADLSGPDCRHDSMVRHTLALLRYGHNGLSGVEHALESPTRSPTGMPWALTATAGAAYR